MAYLILNLLWVASVLWIGALVVTFIAVVWFK